MEKKNISYDDFCKLIESADCFIISTIYLEASDQQHMYMKYTEAFKSIINKTKKRLYYFDPGKGLMVEEPKYSTGKRFITMTDEELRQQILNDSRIAFKGLKVVSFLPVNYVEYFEEWEHVFKNDPELMFEYIEGFLSDNGKI